MSRDARLNQLHAALQSNDIMAWRVARFSGFSQAQKDQARLHADEKRLFMSEEIFRICIWG